MASAPAVVADPAPAPSDSGNADPFAPAVDVHIEDIFGFDPAVADKGDAGGGDTPASPASLDGAGGSDPAPGSSVGAGEGEAAGAREGSPAAEPTPTPTPAPVVEPPSDKDLELTSLKNQLKVLQDKVDKAPEPTPAPAPATPPAKAEPIKITLPDAMKEQLLDPDTAPVAIEQIVSDLTTTMRDMCLKTIEHVTGLMDERMKGGTPPATGSDPVAEADSTRTAMQQQYFSKFPAHNKPELLPIIASVAGEMAVAFPDHPWDDAYIASLGTRVGERLKKLTSLANGSSTGAPPSPLPAGTRSAVPAAGEKDIGDEISDVLGF